MVSEWECECEVEGQMPKPKRRTTLDADCAWLEALYWEWEREGKSAREGES